MTADLFPLLLPFGLSYPFCGCTCHLMCCISLCISGRCVLSVGSRRAVPLKPQHVLQGPVPHHPEHWEGTATPLLGGRCYL